MKVTSDDTQRWLDAKADFSQNPMKNAAKHIETQILTSCSIVSSSHSINLTDCVEQFAIVVPILLFSQ